MLELRDNCNVQSAYLNGMLGVLFTSNFNGKSIFIPAAGYYRESNLVNYGSSGDCWSKTFVDSGRAKNLYFSDTLGARVNQTERYIGINIRPVLDPNI